MNVKDMQIPQNAQWAILELMGHIRYAGLITKDDIFGSNLLRVDIPMPDNSYVTQLVNPASIYRLTFCDSFTAAEASNLCDAVPINPLRK